ncbi:hypothetical protein YC2023_006350 [Brassica napus]
MFPWRLLERRLMILRASSFSNVLSGNGPYSPDPGKRSAVTRELFLEQVMPVHEVQMGFVVFQLSLRAWGTRDANSRSACLSESMSADKQREAKRIIKAKTIIIMLVVVGSLTSKFSHSPELQVNTKQLTCKLES